MRVDTRAAAAATSLLGSWMLVHALHTEGVVFPSDDHQRPADDAVINGDGGAPSREKRDGYGMYAGGGYSSGGGGGYGCSCPYQYCDSGSDLLLYFSAGALLGLLFSLLQGGMMMAPPPPPPPPAMGGRTSSDAYADGDYRLSDLPALVATDVAPLAADLINVYTRSRHNPECMRRWMCEHNRKSLTVGGFRARLTPVSSVALSWLLGDIMPLLETMDNVKEADCLALAPDCKQPLEPPPVTYN